MLSIVKLSQAWFDARGWSLSEGAAFLEIDQACAIPAGAADACPQCDRPNTEYQGWTFAADSATVNSEEEHGRAYVLCICGTVYWYAAVHILNGSTDEARVRAASKLERVASPVSSVPITSSDGLAVNVFDEIDATEAVVVIPGTGTLRFGA